jgi:hypothetical protein
MCKFKLIRYVLLSPELDSFSFRYINHMSTDLSLIRILPTKQLDLESIRKELFSDWKLRCYITLRSLLHLHTVKIFPPLGRYVERYLICRITQPDLVFESGVKNGLGTLVLKRALEKNGSGELICSDTWKRSGFYLGKNRREVLKKNTIEIIPNISEYNKIYFISDSTKDNDQVNREFEAIHKKFRKELYFEFNYGWFENRDSTDLIKKNLVLLCQGDLNSPVLGRRFYLVRITNKTETLV